MMQDRLTHMLCPSDAMVRGKNGFVLVAATFNLFDEDCIQVENFLNFAQRGRLIVTSAPFNAARDQENWINWHQHFCSFKNNWVITFPGESINSICTLSEKIKQDKSLKCWIRCQRSLSAAHVENSRHAGERRRAGRGSTRLLMMLRPPAVGWRWQQSLFPASRLSNFWSQKSFQGKEMLGYGSQQVWSVVH